jgi:hypothetical protein
MKDKYYNSLGNERSVELVFIKDIVEKYYQESNIILDVGGIPSDPKHSESFFNYINDRKIDYRISDFRGGNYPGDFVEYDFKDDKFDIIIFLSSLEHFPQCTESDCLYREGYDKKGYQKSLNILKNNGYIFLTVPFGKHIWQDYHQNYNWQGILDLTEGSTIIESHTYTIDDTGLWWNKTEPSKMEEILYTDKAHGVGCFVMQKK